MKLQQAQRYLTVFLIWNTANAVAQQALAPPAPQAAPKATALLSDSLNSELPKWLHFSGDYRLRVEGFTAGGFKPNNDDAYLLSRLRLNMTVQPQSWLKFAFQAQDAHVFWKNQNPAAPPFQDALDLRQGYVELGDIEKKTVGVRAGRQELAFGDERLIGNTNWLNTARSFDGLRGTYRNKGYRVDVFATRVVRLQDREFDWETPGNNFYGIYGGMEKVIPKATVEPYFLWRRGSGLKTETGVTESVMNFGTVGFRWVGKLPAIWITLSRLPNRMARWERTRSAPGLAIAFWAKPLPKRNFIPASAWNTTMPRAIATRPTEKGERSISSMPRRTTSMVWRTRWAGRTSGTLAWEWISSPRGNGHRWPLRCLVAGGFARRSVQRRQHHNRARFGRDCGQICRPGIGFRRGLFPFQAVSVCRRLWPHLSGNVSESCDPGQFLQLSLRDHYVHFLIDCQRA